MATVLSAISALAFGIHEVAWARLLARAVGNTSYGLGLTLACLMIGSGLGALLAPRLRRAWRAPAGAYALAEIALGLASIALVAYCLFAKPASGILSIADPAGLALDVLVASAIAMVPAIAAGATFPLLIEASGARPHAVYAGALVGACSGTLVMAVLIAPRWGIDVGVGVAAASNGIAAAVAWKCLRPARHPRRNAVVHPQPGPRAPIIQFAAAGALGLALQVVWNRSLVPYAGVSVVTFAAIVASYLAGQAAGFAAHRRFAHVAWLADLALATAPILGLATLSLVSPLSASIGDRDASPLGWVAAVLLVVFAVVAPPALALGVGQARALSSFDAEPRRAVIAARVAGYGSILSAAGAVLATFLLLPSGGPRWTILAVGLPLMATVALERKRRHFAAVGACGAIAVALLAPGPRWFLGSSFDALEPLYVDVGVQDTTAVVVMAGGARATEPRVRRLVAGGVSYSGDSLFAQRYMRLLGHLPASAAAGRDRGLVICIGTGTTVDALRTHGFERIDAVDISASVHDTLGYFDHVNRGVARDPRVRVVIDDGGRYLRRAPHRYDVITLEPPPPRAPGASTLYSRDFYAVVRDRLSPGGAVAQWLPLHGLSENEAAAIVATFVDVFPRASLHLAERNEAVLVARTSDAVWSRPVPDAARRDLIDVGVDATDPWGDTLLVDADGLRSIRRGAALIRDVHPIPEYAPLGIANASSAPLADFADRMVEVSRAREGSFARMLAPALASFVRFSEGEARPLDVRVGETMMRHWLARDPSNAYVQHALGFGDLLQRRLDWLGDELSEPERAFWQARMQRQQRAFAE